MIKKLIAIAAVAVAAAGTAAAQGGSPVLRRADVFTPKVPFTRLATVNGTTAQAVAMARSADGVLHLVFQTIGGSNGLSAISISPSGKPGAAVSALSGWQAGQPGLIRLANGTLEAVFGAISPSYVSSVWGITSSDGGATWSGPADVRAGGSLEALAYGSNITAAVSSGTPVLTLPQAGQVVIQRGLGAGSPNYQLTNSADGSSTDAELATDGATGEVVAAWPSIAGNPKLYVQGASPAIGAVQAMPGQSRKTRPVLSATLAVKPIKNKKLAVIGHTLTVTVSDAGDPVAGAKITAGTLVATTSAKGVAQLKFGSKVKGKLTVTITSPGYWPLTKTVTL